MTRLERAEKLLAECLHMCNSLRNQAFPSGQCIEGVNDTYGVASAIEKYFREGDETQPEQLARLFRSCHQDYQFEFLENLCFDAGLLWKCTAETEEFGSCGYNNHEEDEVCADCGAPRPEIS